MPNDGKDFWQRLWPGVKQGKLLARARKVGVSPRRGLGYFCRPMKSVSLLFFLAVFMAALTAAEPARPNVLLIVADDMGFSDAGCYGGEIATPNLDGLAKGGLRFTQFYNTARCWPSRGALLTGYYAQQVRRDVVPGVKSGLRGTRPAWARLLPELLKAQGYRAYHSGKWHMDGRAMANGFDHSYQVDDHDRYFAPKFHSEDGVPQPAVVPGTGYYSTTAIADHAIKCLKEHAERFGAQPFFEYLAFTAPHFPLQAPPEDIARYTGKYVRGWDALRDERWARLRGMGLGGSTLSPIEREVGPPYAFLGAMQKLGPNEVNRPLPWGELTDGQRDFQAVKMSIHAAMVDRMDREIGRVLAQVKAMGAAENTLVLFLSDNGASAEMMVQGGGHDPAAEPGSGPSFLSLGPGWSSVANTPFRRHKTWLHEGGIATPLIVSWPRGIAARGELRTTPGHVIDLVPTILEVAGGKPPAAWDGQPVPPAPGLSLVPLFAKDGAVQHDSLWWEHEANRALRVGDWKIVAAGKDSPWELYDFSTDRSETKNLASAMPDKVREMAAEWTRQTEQYDALARKDAPPPPALPPLPTKPNIVVVLADQWRAQAFGFAGDPNVKTPNFDQLAGESARFINAVSGLPVCSPTRASLLTGQRPLTHGVFLNDVPLNPAANSLAKVLDLGGYDTAAIGKWHIDGHGRSAFIPRERRQGFDYWKVLECTHNYTDSIYYSDTSEKLHWSGYDALDQTRDACAFLRTRANIEKPFFLWLAWGPPHDPYFTAPEKYRALYDPAKLTLRPNVPANLEAEARKNLAGYYAHCSALDDAMGEILRALREAGLAENTIVLFTADHGDMLGSQGQWKKQKPYDESARVPMLMRWPAGLGKAARQLDAPINSEDVMPTLLGLAGVRIPRSVEGLDYSGYLRGGANPGDGATVLTCVAPFGEWDRRTGGKEYRGLRTTRYTYVCDLAGPWLLFDNTTDPYQQHNLVNDPAHAALQAELDAQLARKLKANDDDFLPGPDYIRERGYKVDAGGTVPYKN